MHNVLGEQVVDTLRWEGWHETRRARSHVVLAARGRPPARVTIPVHPHRPLGPRMLELLAAATGSPWIRADP
jgi:predicted RNA binding protein YcfA (HicA-like mRNA interferase family)